MKFKSKCWIKHLSFMRFLLCVRSTPLLTNSCVLNKEEYDLFLYAVNTVINKIYFWDISYFLTHFYLWNMSLHSNKAQYFINIIIDAITSCDHFSH